MSSQRLKCLDFLSSEVSSAKRATDFMPYVHERDEQGNLISPNTQRRQLKKLTPLKKSNRGELTIRNILQITKDSDLEQHNEITSAPRMPADFINSHFYVQNDWKYMNEHPSKKSKMTRLHNLLNQVSLSRIPNMRAVDYYPNYDYSKKKVIQNVIIPKETKKKVIRHRSQCNEEESIQEKEETPQAQINIQNINIKQSPYYIQMLQKIKFDQGISDISNFQKEIEQTITRCHLSKDKILRGK